MDKTYRADNEGQGTGDTAVAPRTDKSYSAARTVNKLLRLQRARAMVEFRFGLPACQKRLAGGQIVRTRKAIGRNRPCPCGSGLKFKRCCGRGI